MRRNYYNPVPIIIDYMEIDILMRKILQKHKNRRGKENSFVKANYENVYTELVDLF